MPKTILILNPSARGERAAGLTQKIKALAASTTVVRLTSSPGEARSIAGWAVKEGFERVIAAGGDGTVNEVVNGIAGTSLTLGILPIGTMNVFASELGLPKSLNDCWAVIQSGATREIDLPDANGHAFVQMAGVGLDAQALQQTSWDAKRNLGPLSYLISATQVAARTPPRLMAESDGVLREGSFVLIGNGRFYGGPFPVFPDARIDDGLLDVLIFKNLTYLDIIRYLHGVLFGIHTHYHDVEHFQTARLAVTCEENIPVEVDGEVLGNVPVTFSLNPRRLRVLAPGGRESGTQKLRK